MTGWKKILLEGDAVSLSTNTPASVGTTAGAGSGTLGSKDDHVHDLGVGCIDAANLFASGVVDAAAIGTGAVGASGISTTDTAITMKQIILPPQSLGTGTIDGTVYYATSDKHPYVYQV